MSNLVETYDYCAPLVGKKTDPKKTPLLPLGHSTQNAHIEVVINGNGEFVRARLLDKDEEKTIIPVTEDSCAKGNGNFPHPLCDKLVYVAGDYKTYVDPKKKEYFESYINNLKEWTDYDPKQMKIKSVYNYLVKESLIEDLINVKVLSLKNGKLATDIKLGHGQQSAAFVRFRVEIPRKAESAIWLDEEVYISFMAYYNSTKVSQELCYIKGEILPTSIKHPSKVRHVADKSKLISANDDSGFTYRGRISDKNKIVGMSYEASQKAHLALRWLIEHQGYHNGEQAIVAWAIDQSKIPDILEDTEESFFKYEDEENAEDHYIQTEEAYASKLSSAIAGYASKLESNTKVMIIGVEAATTGRLSITYYQEYFSDEFLMRIKDWHSTCIWRHDYKKRAIGLDDEGKQLYKYYTFIGAPSPKDIVYAAYGDHVSDSLKKATIERLLPCITGTAKVPYDLVKCVVEKASNPIIQDKWEWQKNLSIACALIKKYKHDRLKEEWEMALDVNEKDRSYIFGRLLAVAQQIEEWALNDSGEKRDTNAERLMHQFKIHPYKTWGILNDKLRPYISRLGKKSTHLVELMTEINSKLTMEAFTSTMKLDDSYLLGYYCQRQVFIDEKKKRIDDKNQDKLNKEMNEEE
jgi:CRISPR-associated protein Csd1